MSHDDAEIAILVFLHEAIVLLVLLLVDHYVLVMPRISNRYRFVLVRTRVEVVVDHHDRKAFDRIRLN